MSKPFAKLFDTPHGQLLATIDSDGTDDGSEFGPCFFMRAGGPCSVQMKEGPWPDDDIGWQAVAQRLANFDQAAADRAAETLVGMAQRLLAE